MQKKQYLCSRKGETMKIDSQHMRKFYSLIILLALSLSLWAWNSPVPIPNVGDARIRIVGQNAQNYLSVLDASNSSCKTEEAFQAKTNKMANVFLALQADIVAICEVQRDDEILSYICNAMNTLYGQSIYTYITDGNVGEVNYNNYMPLKSGFIYRSDKVTPVGNSSSPYTYAGEYNCRMRIQAFKENSTNEWFVLSMNHFKAKDSSEDQGEGTRITNANRLISALNYITTDPDILIMGDLNAYMDEQPIENLINAGYAEQLLVYDPDAYTYNYHGDLGILDHAMANSTMAAQITGAYAYHINTGDYYNYYNYHYSDHDAVLVGLKLGTQQGEGFEQIPTPPAARKFLINGTIYIKLNGTIYDLFGNHLTDY